MELIRAIRLTSVFFALTSLFGCSRTVVPDVYVSADGPAQIMPDYVGVTVPPNIAPLNFEVLGDSVSECVARVVSGDLSLVCGGERSVVFPLGEWHNLLSHSVGKELSVELFTKVGGTWRSHRSFSIFVAPDSIDSYVTYRSIPPYNTYDRMSVVQRNIESFDAVDVYSNLPLDRQPDGNQCMNCHSFQNYRTQRMHLHVRGDYGGTLICCDDTIYKCSVKAPGAISGAVYVQWHPYLDVLAYSLNTPYLLPHTSGACKGEVIDAQSALVLYDVKGHNLYSIPNEPDAMPTFPAWSPDGEYLYYCQAEFHFTQLSDGMTAEQRNSVCQFETSERYRDMRYDIYRRKFNTKTFQLGEPEPVLIVSPDSLSASMPRISPDGRYLLTSIGDYGNFHIYHPESDLYLTDLSLKDSVGNRYLSRPLSEANSSRAESYHNWSSNGRWIVFQSRRRDNNYTNLYFSYFDSEGRAHKAFELPQGDPRYESVNLCSYNLPEFTTEPVRVDMFDLVNAVLKQSAQPPANVQTDGSTSATMIKEK